MDAPSIAPVAPVERFSSDMTAMVRRCCPNERTVTATFGGTVTFEGRIEDCTGLAELLSRTHHCQRRITITGDSIDGRVTSFGSDSIPDEWKSPDPGAAFRAFLDGLSPEEIQAYCEKFAQAGDTVDMAEDFKDDLRFQ